MRVMIDRNQLTGGDGTFDPDRARRDKRIGYGHDVDYHLTDTGTAFHSLRHHRQNPAHLARRPRLVRANDSPPGGVTLTPAGRTGLVDYFNLDWSPTT
jgi:hypothetical protein